MKGKLTLVPLPLNELDPIDSKTQTILLNAYQDGALILVEEAKPCRRRWLQYKLPREAIENFHLYNEHNKEKDKFEYINLLNKGKDIFLMSDCGLPAFCDPGQELVDLCHQNGIAVTATPFANSISLAVSLSGFPHSKFNFEGFLSNKSNERRSELKKILKTTSMSVLMDTPYRLKYLLQDLCDLGGERDIFLAMDLNEDSEELVRGKALPVMKKVKDLKKKFILIIGPQHV